MKLEFTPRNKLSNYEWDPQLKNWNRPELNREILNELSKRSTLNGLLRVCLFIFLLVVPAMAAVFVSRYSLWLAIPVLYVYYFFYGFLVTVAHELQHRTVFGKSFNWFSEIIFFIIQTLLWNSPRYARISHQLHHRYTMVRGVDPETNWPEVITSKWLLKYFWGLIMKILVVGAIIDLFHLVMLQIRRIIGIKDRMMMDHCSDKDIAVIRVESLAILLIHIAMVAIAIGFRRWEPIVFITLALSIGSPIEGLWHSTEHIGRLYNVKDLRLCTRSVRVNPFVHLIYGGLDDHVDHHFFPGVPSRNLPKLHRILCNDLAEPRNMAGCWREMFAIAKEKDSHPEHEYVPVAL